MRMMSRQKLLILAGGTVPILVMVVSLIRLISYDTAIAIILATFAPALVPAIVQNYLTKQGWSKVSTVTTTSGQFGIMVIFFVMGLTFSFAVGALLTTMWAILTVQAFRYSSKGMSTSSLDQMTKMAMDLLGGQEELPEKLKGLLGTLGNEEDSDEPTEEEEE